LAGKPVGAGVVGAGGHQKYQTDYQRVLKNLKPNEISLRCTAVGNFDFAEANIVGAGCHPRQVV